jgi:hypothetical protein
MFDARGTTFEEIAISRDPACPACGDGVAGRRPEAAAVAAG